MCCCVPALLREPLRRSPSTRPQLEIYSASGVSIASFPVRTRVQHTTCPRVTSLFPSPVLPVFQWKSGPVVHLGWSVNDELLCVQEDGTVLIYDLFGSFKRHFSMGQVGPVRDVGVGQVCV